MKQRRIVRIGVTGAECTGKTALAHALGERFYAPVVEDYAREYFSRKIGQGDATVFPGDIVRVIAEQSYREDIVARVTDRMMICDTDVFTVAIWHERYLGGCRKEIDELAQMRSDQGAGMDLYLLCVPDFPFVPDEIRAGEPLRTAMHQVFVGRLEESGKPYIVLDGPLEERLATASAHIQTLVDAQEA